MYGGGRVGTTAIEQSDICVKRPRRHREVRKRDADLPDVYHGILVSCPDSVHAAG